MCKVCSDKGYKADGVFRTSVKTCKGTSERKACYYHII